MRTPKSLSRLALCACAGLLVSVASPAMAQNTYLDQATELGSATPGTIHADEILFPVVAEMDAPPMSVAIGADLDAMLMLQPGDAAWSKFERWAQKDEQQAVLAAIKEITDPESKKPFVLEIPFGREHTDLLNEDAGLWIEITTDDLLASAKYHYLKKMEWVNALSLFEGMRLAAEGEGDASMDTLLDAVRFGRLLAERPSVPEVTKAYTFMRLGTERMRDVIYTHYDAFESEKLTEVAEELDQRVMRTRGMPMPMIEKYAALQLLDRTFTERGAVEAGEFAQTFAKLESGDHPLRRLSEAARYRDEAAGQSDWFDQGDWIEKVWGDFQARWKVPGYQNPLFDKSTQFEQMDKRSQSLVRFAGEGLTDLIATRTAVELDMGGTLNALGICAFHKAENKFPPNIKAVEPGYVNRLMRDPFNYSTDYVNETLVNMSYWVPIRDQEFDRRVQPHPYAVEVVLPDEGESLFVAGAPKGGSADAVLKSLSLKSPGVARLIGRPAPEIELDDWHNGDPITINGTNGNIRVMIFWATWCGPCKAAIPGNNDLFKKYKDRGVKVFGVCDSNRGNSMASTADQHNMAYPTGVMKDGNKEADAYSLPHWPYTIIIDSKGVIRGAGVRPGPDLEKAVKALLAEEAGAVEEDFAMGGAAAQPTPTTLFDGMDLNEMMSSVNFQALSELTEEEMTNMTLSEMWDLMELDVPQELRDAMGSMKMSELTEQLIANPNENPIATFLANMNGPSFDIAPSGKPVNSFTVMLDDSTFLLYSTGPDGMDNRAAKVGAGGDDILIWPPLMSLTRQHQHSEL